MGQGITQFPTFSTNDVEDRTALTNAKIFFAVAGEICSTKNDNVNTSTLIGWDKHEETRTTQSTYNSVEETATSSHIQPLPNSEGHDPTMRRDLGSHSWIHPQRGEIQLLSNLQSHPTHGSRTKRGWRGMMCATAREQWTHRRYSIW